MVVRIGTAGWTIPRAHAGKLPAEGSHLQRYSRTLPCAEINSTFYRPSRHSTWLRWAASVPDEFRFAVKAPKAISHDAALELTSETAAALNIFMDQARLLGSRLGVLLFQLPPKQALVEDRTRNFFRYLRSLYEGPVVIEPRHATWFSPEANSLLLDLHLARAAADPAPVPEAALPGGVQNLVYYRLHGSPRKYYSEYGPEWLGRLVTKVQSHPATNEAWVIFDNTASGAALGNALELIGLWSSASAEQ